jgi:DNA-binding transcriptional regulator YdaS (Cro superfamily)
MIKPKNPFSRAVEIVGSAAAMARLLDLTPTMVYQMQNGIRPVPATVCHAIEMATGGEVGRRELKPKGYEKLWPELLK